MGTRFQLCFDVMRNKNVKYNDMQTVNTKQDNNLLSIANTSSFICLENMKIVQILTTICKNKTNLNEKYFLLSTTMLFYHFVKQCFGFNIICSANVCFIIKIVNINNVRLNLTYP